MLRHRLEIYSSVPMMLRNEIETAKREKGDPKPKMFKIVEKLTENRWEIKQLNKLNAIQNDE